MERRLAVPLEPRINFRFFWIARIRSLSDFDLRYDISPLGWSFCTFSMVLSWMSNVYMIITIIAHAQYSTVLYIVPRI